MTKTQNTKGTEFAAMVRTAYRMNTRTRTYRDGGNMKRSIIEDIQTSNQYPGYWSAERTALYSAAFGTMLAYSKHIMGGRVSPMLSYRIEMMSPWEFAGMLGDMIDAGVTNNGQGEMFFHNMNNETKVAA